MCVDLTDQELITRSQQGDRGAFEALVRRYQRKAVRIAFGVLRNSEDAMDAAQEAFVKVYRNLDKFKGNSSFKTWLYRIVVNVSIDQIRKRQRSRGVEYDDTYRRSDEAHVEPLSADTRPMHPGFFAENQELAAQLTQALEALSENHRTVIVLREIEGLSYEEIAQTLDCHLGTVMSRLHHARKNLQRALQPYLELAGDQRAERAGDGVGRRRS